LCGTPTLSRILPGVSATGRLVIAGARLSYSAVANPPRDVAVISASAAGAVVGALARRERRIRAVAASVAVGIPVDLRETGTGLGTCNAQLLITAITRAAGQPP
jgi:hypothetical protein